MYVYKLLGLLTLLQVIYVTTAQSRLDMVVDYAHCNSTDPEGLLGHLNCSTSKNAKRRSFSIEFNFTRNIPEFQFSFVFLLPHKPHDYVVLNATNENGCNLLECKTDKVLLSWGRKVFDLFGNFPKQCPFKMNELYYLRNFRFDMSKFSAFTFESHLELYFDFIVRGNKLISGKMHGHVFRKPIKYSKKNKLQ